MKYYSYTKQFKTLKEAVHDVVLLASLAGKSLESLSGITVKEQLISSPEVFKLRLDESGDWFSFGYSRDGATFFYFSGKDNEEAVGARFSYYGFEEIEIPSGWLRISGENNVELARAAISRDMQDIGISLYWEYRMSGCYRFCAALSPLAALTAIEKETSEIVLGTVLAMAVDELRHKNFSYRGVPAIDKEQLRVYENAYRHAMKAIATACVEKLGFLAYHGNVVWGDDMEI